jgi:broad specificity phosphatase PhoE
VPQSSVRGWERAADAQVRIIRAVERVLSQAPDNDDIAIIGHGGTGTLLLCHLAGVPIGSVPPSADPEPAKAVSLTARTAKRRRRSTKSNLDRSKAVQFHFQRKHQRQ